MPVRLLITMRVLAYPVLVMVICVFWCQQMQIGITYKLVYMNSYMQIIIIYEFACTNLYSFIHEKKGAPLIPRYVGIRKINTKVQRNTCINSIQICIHMNSSLGLTICPSSEFNSILYLFVIVHVFCELP